ncbi:hypothetical protein HT102_01225 [Hoyosella sp. G463]|uniref:Uncharacterized protein n=1 Tax=Lolliginicoccus lacisalsi TaxID=2742202 RepID=A0A927J9S0_9ACTN|nr:hypothetical protein [Lolliginicoccus lacisalsi]MBD8505111.1 hypothetical protein [Lolliginicoccus lacisalsi]
MGSSQDSGLQWPISVRLDTIAAMLNFEIHNHPVYQGIEVQYFDDAEHGTGILVLMSRRENGKVDVYHQAGLSIDRMAYGIGAGLGEWRTTKIEPAVLDVTDTGVRARIALRDTTGRSIEISVDDRGGKPQRSAEFLAPVGAAIEQPTALMLVWMRRFNLVRRTSIDPVVRIDGVPVTLGRLPGAWLHRRHLIKYASGLWVVNVNPPDSDGRREAGRPEAAHARLHFSAEPPAPGTLSHGDERKGKWSLSIGEHADVISGEWVCTGGEVATLTLTVTRGWRPRGLPPLMRVVTTVLPVFRRWPTTYLWEARVDLRGTPEVAAEWRRTKRAGESLYTRVTSSR